MSVLIPVYNVERYVGECLDSLLAQSFGDFEAICVNDGSTDGSPAVLADYAARDARIRVIDKANSGYGASMNRALDEARGTYVAILESDDRMCDGALEHLYKMARLFDADVVKGSFNLYWSTPDERREPYDMVPPSKVGTMIDVAEEPFIFGRKISIWSALYRRDLLDGAGIRFLETPGASYQDASFSFKVWAAAERPVFTDRAVIDYRQDNEGSSVKSRGKLFAVCDEYAEADRWLDERVMSEERKLALKRAELAQKYDSYMWNLARIAPELREEFLLRMAEEYQESLRSGELDLGSFPTWKRANLSAIMDDPVRYAREHASFRDAGMVGRALHYLRLGGPRLLIDFARSRLERRR